MVTFGCISWKNGYSFNEQTWWQWLLWWIKSVFFSGWTSWIISGSGKVTKVRFFFTITCFIFSFLPFFLDQLHFEPVCCCCCSICFSSLFAQFKSLFRDSSWFSFITWIDYGCFLLWKVYHLLIQWEFFLCAYPAQFFSFVKK